MGNKPKSFFKTPSASQILRTTDIEYADIGLKSADLVRLIENLEEGTSLYINDFIIPPNHINFLKKDVPLTIKIKDKKKKVLEIPPYMLKRETMDSHLGNFDWIPNGFRYGDSKIIRLTSIVNAVKLFYYAPSEEDNTVEKAPTRIAITNQPYDMLTEKFNDYKLKDITLSKNGATIILSVPSRTKGKARYTEIRYVHVPIIDDKNKFRLAYKLETTHNCKKKAWAFSYPYAEQPETLLRLCEHEIAGYFVIMHHYKHTNNNLVPSEMNLTGIPTERMVRRDNNMDFGVVVQTPLDDGPRKLIQAEKEFIHWCAILSQGHDANLYAKGTRSGGTDIRKYKYPQTSKP